MNLNIDQLQTFIPALTAFAIRIAGAGGIVLISIYLNKWAVKVFDKSFEKMEMEVSLKKFLLSLIRAVFYGVTAFIVLERVGVSSASIIAVLGSAGLALGLAMQGSLSNFAGGVLILLMKPFKVGDYIVCEECAEGTVAVIGLVYTTLMTVDNKNVVVPNGTLANSTLTNVTAQQQRRLDLSVTIHYSADLLLAKEILKQLLNGHGLVIKEPSPQVYVSELGERGVVLGARGWVKTENYWNVKWELTEAVKLLFDEHGIEIAYPALNVQIRS